MNSKKLFPNNPIPNRQFRLLGLVTDAQHKVSRQGNKYGNFIIEDYSGKTELFYGAKIMRNFRLFLSREVLFFITGFFRQRFNRPEFEFKVITCFMAEALKRNLTKQLDIEIHPKDVTTDVVDFIEKNVRNHPGMASLKFTFNEPKNKSENKFTYHG